MSLYRKYRPQRFADLVGQDHIRTTILNALRSDQVNHAYLFTGPRGTGKTSAARLIARAVNCLAPQDAEPCNSCEICRDILDSRLVDVIEIDAASNRGIDEMRDLKEKIIFTPTRAKNKVYIIDEVHMLTKEAFNALLKTLEEPPTHVFFILATTEAHKVPLTIVSRCQRFDFRRIDDTTIIKQLLEIAEKEKIDAEKEALEAIARCSMGGLRDAIGLLEQLNVNGKVTYAHVRDILGISNQEAMDQLFDFVWRGEVKKALDHINNIYQEGNDLNQFNKDFLWFLRQKMVAAINVGDSGTARRILVFIEIFQKSYEQQKFAVIPQLPLEIAIVEVCLGVMGAKNEISANHIEGIDAIKPMAKITEKSVPVRVHQPIHTPDVGVLSLDELQKEWPKVLKHLGNAIASRTLSTGKIQALMGNIVKISFQNKFNLDKFNEPLHRLALESALFAVFQLRFKVVPVLEDNQNKPETDPNTTRIMEFLGGELVE